MRFANDEQQKRSYKKYHKAKHEEETLDLLRHLKHLAQRHDGRHANAKCYATDQRG